MIPSLRPDRIAASLALIYIALGSAWILFSDRLLSIFVDPARISRLQTFKGWFYVALTGAVFYFLIRRYLRHIRRHEEALRGVVRAVAGQTGESYFRSLVENLTSALGVDFAMVGERVGDAGDRLRTVAAQAHGRSMEIAEYPLGEAPCAGVMELETSYIPSRARDRFPHCRLFRELAAESYIGLPLVGGSGQAIGMLAVMSSRPYRDRELAEPLLKIFAMRAAAELERQHEQELRQSQFEQISAIFDSLNALVYVVDMDQHRILYMNRFGSELFGPNWRDKPCFEVLQNSSPCDSCANDQLRGGFPQHPLIREIQHQGNGKWYQCIEKAIRWPDGRLVRLQISLDITERKEIDRLKDEILSAVSHEMRTPLTAVLGYAEFLLENEIPPQERQSCLRTLCEQAERLNNLIGDFLHLQRLQARRQSAHCQPISLPEMLKKMLEKVPENDAARLKLVLPADLPPILGEELDLLEIVERLISNARKYSPRGGEIILSAARQKGEVILSIRDRGIGIPADQLERIFDPLYRVDNSDRRPTGGAGLGLALVREIVREQGGRIWAESAEGKGSAFFVALRASS